MIIPRQKSFSEKKEKDKKAEKIVGALGVSATGAKLVRDFGEEGHDINFQNYSIKSTKQDINRSKEILKDVSDLRDPNKMHPERMRFTDGRNRFFRRNSDVGQLEAAENAMYWHDKAKDAGLKGVAKKQLKSAEKHAKKALELSTKRLADKEAERIKSFKSLGKTGAAGLALTAAGVGITHEAKKLHNKNE